MFLPRPRGPLTSALSAAMRANRPDAMPAAVGHVRDPLTHDDVQLALWICYELHYQGFDDVDEAWEWEPAQIALRRQLEEAVLSALRIAVDVPDLRPVPEALFKLVENDTGPSMSSYLQRHASVDQFAEYVQQRSIYQLKEADPHTWAIPRLNGRAKAALIEIQADEYGAGHAGNMHSVLFGHTLRGLGLDAAYGAYIDIAAPISMAISNVMSLFALRRELRGAIVGHLAAYEMSSSLPCRRNAAGLRRLGAGEEACSFYDAHVTADALHEQIAAYDLCGSLADSEPGLADDILWGAAVCIHLETRFAQHLLRRWQVAP